VTTSNTSNTIISASVPRVPLAGERRLYKRFEVRRKVYLRIKEKNEKKTVLFWTKDICFNGLSIEYTDFPFVAGKKYEFVIVFTIKENILRIMYVDGYVRHRTKKANRIGFMIYRKPHDSRL